MRTIIQKLLFLFRVYFNIGAKIHTLKCRLIGVQIGSGTVILPGANINWPHQLKIGKSCICESGIDFKFSDWHRPGPSILIGDYVFLGRDTEFNIMEHVEIGDYCLIGSGSKFIDHDHGMQRKAMMSQQPNTNAPIRLERDVWLGANVVVLKGVVIGEGAVVAAGAVVTKDIPPYEIWGGIPARRIGVRPE